MIDFTPLRDGTIKYIEYIEQENIGIQELRPASFLAT